MRGENPAQEPVIGRHEGAMGRLQQDGPAGSAHSGVNDGDMDGVGGEIAVAESQHEGALSHVLRRNSVGEINETQVGVNGESKRPS